MTSYASGGVSNSYWYRADNMRVAKLVGSTGTTTMYRYDGQMGFEDVDTAGSGTTVTDYGPGARGIDYISANSGTGANVDFPLYDGHGNMIGTLARSGQGSYTTGNVREYDAWGSVRSGQATGDPKGRYCATLGHKQDDESGLVYMRARYLEPASGRFLSEDPQFSGANWFAYCSSNPVNRVDGDGKADTFEDVLAGLGMYFAIGAVAITAQGNVLVGILSARLALLCFTLLFIGDTLLNASGFTAGQKFGVAAGRLLMGGLGLGVAGIQIPPWMNGYLGQATADAAKGKYCTSQIAVCAIFAYSLAVCGALLAMDADWSS